MKSINRTVLVATRMRRSDALALKRACREARMRQSEFVRRAIARLVAETLDAKKEAA